MVFGRSRPKLVVTVLLTATLALTAILAYQAQSAARSHREVAERTLRDYAAFAAWEYARSAREFVFSSLWPVFRTLWPRGREGGRFPHLTAAQFAELSAQTERGCRCAPTTDPDGCGCGGIAGHRYYCLLDLKTGALTVAPGDEAPHGALPAPSVVSWIERSLKAVRADSMRNNSGLIIGRPRSGNHSAPETIAYMFMPDTVRGPATVAYAYDVDPVRLTSMLGRALRRVPLLPPSLTGTVVNDSVLSTAVTDTTGRVLFRSGDPAPPALTAHDTVGALYGDLTVGLAVRPEWADRLVIGGLPQSRLPLILGLFAVAAGLVAVALLQTRREQELGRLRADFTASVSHELRTPLAQILLFAETLSLGRMPREADRRHAVDVIIQETRRLMHLVENVLHFSSPRRPPRRDPARAMMAPTALAPLVRDVLASFEPLATASGSTLNAELDPHAAADVDPHAFRQMLLNLLDNAAKYGPEGQTIRVTLALTSDDPPRVRIVVDDEGPGIPASDRDAVWEPFARLAPARDGHVRGSGVGLAVVRELADRAGGTAWISDAPSGGARLVLDFPGVRMAVAEGEVVVTS